MSMLSLASFYDPDNWTRRFWEYGSGYTIVPGRHIGLDITTRGQAKRVPALFGGVVDRVIKTSQMGYVVVMDTGRSVGRYISYCHIAGHNLPRVGRWYAQGEEFATIAIGPKNVPYSDPNYPGTAWTGAHLHLVIHSKPSGAYLMGQRDTYVEPEDQIRYVLATPAGTDATPFIPEGFLDMLSDTQQRQIYEALVIGGTSASAYYTPQAIINVLRTEIATAIGSIAAGGILYPGAGYYAFPALVDAIRADDGTARPAVPEVDEDALAASLAPLVIAKLDTLDEATVDRIAQRVADVQAARQAE